MVIAVVLVIMAIGSVIFHIWSPWWFTPLASNWGSLDDAIVITFWITGVAYVAVILFMAYCTYRYRYKKERRAEYEPENAKVEWWLTIVTAVGVVGLLTPGLIAWNDFVSVPKDVIEVEVLGKQWDWSYRLPGKDGKLGTSSTRLVSDDNPFGINPKDPNGKDDVLIEGDDLHLRLDQPVKMLLRSIDVLHDFYVPQFRAKMDLVPGMVTFFWMTPTRAGTFDVLCAELCGVGHHTMRGTVIVDAKGAFDRWLGEQETFAALYPEAAKVKQAAIEVPAPGGNEGASQETTIFTAKGSNSNPAVR
jgi:cytochrome c oxidase subunit 2